MDYLRILAREDRPTLSKIARSLSVSKPTALEMLRKLSAKDLVLRDEDGFYRITDRGRRILREIERRHRVLEVFLAFLGFDERRSCREASKIDLEISEDVVDALCEFLNHPRKCPCGEEIPRCSRER